MKTVLTLRGRGLYFWWIIRYLTTPTSQAKLQGREKSRLFFLRDYSSGLLLNLGKCKLICSASASNRLISRRSAFLRSGSVAVFSSEAAASSCRCTSAKPSSAISEFNLSNIIARGKLQRFTSKHEKIRTTSRTSNGNPESQAQSLNLHERATPRPDDDLLGFVERLVRIHELFLSSLLLGCRLLGY
jgi:hypothetical protein